MSVLLSKLVSAVPKWWKHEVCIHTGHTCRGPESSGDGKVADSVWISARDASLTVQLYFDTSRSNAQSRDILAAVSQQLLVVQRFIP